MMLPCRSTPVAGTVSQLKEKKGCGRGGCSVQVYLAEGQPWDMHTARLQLRLPRPRKVASHVSITTEAFAFLKKHDDCASSEGGRRSHGGRVKAANFCWTFVEPHIIPAQHSAPPYSVRRIGKYNRGAKQSECGAGGGDPLRMGHEPVEHCCHAPLASPFFSFLLPFLY